MWRQSETPILKRARITRENLVALSKPFARSGGSLGGNEGNWTTRKAVNSGSSLQTNPVHVSLGVTGSRRRAEPRMRNLVFSKQHVLHPHRGPGTNRIGRLHFRRPRISINVESLRTDAELPSGTRSKERLLGHDRIQINRPSHTWTIR